MAEKDYSKYIIREPLAFNIFPPYKPRMLFDSANHFPEMGFGIRYTYLISPIEMERPHAHDFDQFFCFMGTPEDMQVFDGEVELYLGEEETKNIIDCTTVVYIPKGMIHCPIIWKRVSQPMMFINIVLSSQYTRTVAHEGFHNTLELDAKEVSIKEAGNILGVAIPEPAYLPDGYKVQEIYLQDNRLRLLISDEHLMKRKITIGDATGARQRYAFESKMEISYRWLPEGKPEGLKEAGVPVTIGKGQGIRADREINAELIWLLPQQTTPERKGQFEIVIYASKSMTQDELVKTAESIVS
ncbi:MAG TPA: hypothetical protein G4O16_00100 [Dehalococcoidia bacterium]|nr:hypothetical protein [Dehalococcoidia bacterium]